MKIAQIFRVQSEQLKIIIIQQILSLMIGGKTYLIISDDNMITEPNCYFRDICNEVLSFQSEDGSETFYHNLENLVIDDLITILENLEKPVLL